MRKKIFTVLLSLLLFVTIIINLGYTQNNEKWKDVFDFSKVIKYWDQANLSPNYNSIALTKDYIYVTASQRNRIIGFSYDSQYVKEIKDVKTKKHSSFYPYIMFFDSNKFYVVNEDYQYVDIVDNTGEVVNEFKIKDSEEISGIFVKSGILFLNVKYKKKERKRKLITIFSEKGKKLDEVGSLLDAKNHLGYIKFNSIKFAVKGNILYGAFEYYPLIFSYNIRTKRELLWKDLRYKGLKEIDILVQRVKEYHKDWVDNIANDNVINLLTICSGFDVDSEGNMYYLINSDYKNEFPTTILKFDSHGKLLKRYHPSFNSTPIGYSVFLKVFNNSLYLIGGYNNNYHLFSLDINNP